MVPTNRQRANSAEDGRVVSMQASIYGGGVGGGVGGGGGGGGGGGDRTTDPPMIESLSPASPSRSEGGGGEEGGTVTIDHGGSR